MELADYRVGDVVVIILGGTLTSSDVVSLHEAMSALLRGGATRVVIDLAELSYLDSLGLGELVACQLRAIKAGITLRLANPDKRVRDLLLLTQLITVFEAYDSLEDALESLDAVAGGEG